MTQIHRVVFTVDQVAKAVGVRRARVVEWIADGRLATVDVDGRLRVGAAELERISREGIPKAGKFEEPRKRRGSGRASPPANPGNDIREIDV